MKHCWIVTETPKRKDSKVRAFLDEEYAYGYYEDLISKYEKKEKITLPINGHRKTGLHDPSVGIGGHILSIDKVLVLEKSVDDIQMMKAIKRFASMPV